MIAWLVLPLAFAASFALTGALRKYAIHRSLIDIPNARSSHAVPTPRGGGVAIVSVVAVAVLWSVMAGSDKPAMAGAVLVSGVAVALLGFADDHGHIAAGWRLLGHFLAAGLAVFWLGGLPVLPALGVSLDLGWFGQLFALLFMVWMLNLYNFMDGIDGIASIEAICVCAGGMLCHAAAVRAAGADASVVLAGVMIAAVAGFACWNFPRARIFMGDAGSGFIGFTLAVFALDAAWDSPRLLWSWLILLGVFIVDATFTLLRRLLRGEAIYQAHRSHAYQVAARRMGKHAPVTGLVAAINLCWLLPWALAVAYAWIDGVVALAVGYAPLVGLCLWLRAGTAEPAA